jgi:hypothetical protein
MNRNPRRRNEAQKDFRTQIPSLPLQAEERAKGEEAQPKTSETFDNITDLRDQKLLSPTPLLALRCEEREFCRWWFGEPFCL